MRALAIFAFGLVVGVGVIVACGDDSPGDVDAAVACDCPAAEAPWVDRMTRRTDMKTIAAGDLNAVARAACNDGELAVHGSCSSGGTMFLMDSGSTDGTGWGCSFRNEDVNPHEATSTVLCLAPPSD